MVNEYFYIRYAWHEGDGLFESENIVKAKSIKEALEKIQDNYNIKEELLINRCFQTDSIL